jgi:lysophospholipase L1-like esterase
VNAGVSGETTEEGLVRLPRVLSDYSPSLLILLEGGNDILRNKDFSDIERNLAQMIELAQGSGAQVVLIGVPEKSLFSNSAPFYRDLADKYDLVFEPKLIGSLMRSPSIKSDSVHFNKEGYELMARGISDLLAQHGAFD